MFYYLYVYNRLPVFSSTNQTNSISLLASYFFHIHVNIRHQPMRPGQRIRYSKSLGAGLSGDWITVGTISSLTFRPASRSTQPSLQWLPVLSLDVQRSVRGADIISPSPFLLPRLRMVWSCSSASRLCLQRHVMEWPLTPNYVEVLQIFPVLHVFLRKICIISCLTQTPFLSIILVIHGEE